MFEAVTKRFIAAQLLRLNEVFAKHSDADLERLTGGYHGALQDLDAEQVEGAIGMAIRQEPRFPVPARIREHAQEWRKVNRHAHRPVARPDADGVARICRYCDATPRLALLRGWDLKTGADILHHRYIAPCDTARPHPDGHVPLPGTFVEWHEG